MKYFLDTEFIEGTQKGFFLKRRAGGYTRAIPTIDLISIGIVAEDGREYYAISKDFNLKEAWNRYEEKVNKDYKSTIGNGSDGHYNPMYIKEYWIRDNVLKPIYNELMGLLWEEFKRDDYYFTYSDLKELINKYGKTNKQIAEEIKMFIANYKFDDIWDEGARHDSSFGNGVNNTYYYIKAGVDSPIYVGTSKSDKPEFYGYYADYDWVVFCWLFGKMMDLPNGFPMYCNDLKQSLDERNIKYQEEVKLYLQQAKGVDYIPQNYDIKNENGYPKQTNEHNALADARWTKDLYNFLKDLK
jgi:hypothetical protein